MLIKSRSLMTQSDEVGSKRSAKTGQDEIKQCAATPACRAVARYVGTSNFERGPLLSGSGATAPKAFGTGGKGIRTPGLLIANETLYQLSYTPEQSDLQTMRGIRNQCKTRKSAGRPIFVATTSGSPGRFPPPPAKCSASSSTATFCGGVEMVG